MRAKYSIFPTKVMFVKFFNIKAKSKSKNKFENPPQSLGVQTVLGKKNLDPLENEFSTLSRYREMKIYSALRENIPIIDAAINKILRLLGGFKILYDDPDINNLLDYFVKNVPVNSNSRGMNAFIINHLNYLLTFGTAVSEVGVNPQNHKIAAIFNASLENVELKHDEKNPSKLKIFKKNSDGTLTKAKFPDLILVSSLNPNPGEIYGNSILKGLPFLSKILMKIYDTIGKNWERLGNVRFAITYKPNAKGDTSENIYAKERAAQIASEWSKAMKSNSNSDFVAIGDVNIRVIGADNQILDSQVPVKQILEQIISKLGVPPFLLGLSWSTTETMSTQQAEILANELESYRRIIEPTIYKICSLFLRFSGISFDQNNLEIVWDKINLKDELQIANARLTNARARKIEDSLDKTC